MLKPNIIDFRWFSLSIQALKVNLCHVGPPLLVLPCKNIIRAVAGQCSSPELMDGWVRVLRPFNSISVISKRWKGEHERLCAMKRRLGSGRISPPVGFEPATLWSEVGSDNHSAMWSPELSFANKTKLFFRAKRRKITGPWNIGHCDLNLFWGQRHIFQKYIIHQIQFKIYDKIIGLWKNRLLWPTFFFFRQRSHYYYSSSHDWKIVDWDVKPQHNQPTHHHTVW